jgi:heat-inducible transcriptional repressor
MVVDLDSRKQEILRTVIRSYIETAEPVGSEVLAQRTRLGVSAATIRNEMATLEEMGYLAQPHPSAGRIPTDRGYRVYVDSLREDEALSSSERTKLRRRLASALVERERVPEEIARTLATVTHYASLVAQSHPDRLVLKHLHLIPLSATRVLTVIVTNAGVLRGRALDLLEPMEPEALDRLSRLVSQRLAGYSLGEITDEVLTQIVGEAAWQQRVVRQLTEWLLRQMLAADHQVHIDGTVNILTQPEFRDARAARLVLEALEREEVLSDLLAGAPDRPVWITIGSEHRIEDLRGCSVVAAAYRVGGRAVGTLGIVGPTRMEYARVISLVRYLADSLSDVLADPS